MNTTQTEQWQTLWINIHLATMTDTSKSYGEIEDGALAVSDGKIVWLGKEQDLPQFDKDQVEVIDGGGRWMTPGLIDCHTHLVYGGNRANEFEMRLQGKSYQEIANAGGGIVSTVKATRAASEQELLASALPRLSALHHQGVTTVEVKSGYGLDTITEIKMLKVAGQLEKKLPVTIKRTFLGAHALPIEYKDRPDAYIDLVCDEMMPTIANQQLADTVDVFCEGIGFDIKQTERVFTAAKKLGLSIKVHAEQLSDLGGTELAAKYPLSIISPKSHAFLNSCYGNMDNQQKAQGEQFVMLNAADAIARNVKEGNTVKVFNGRGAFEGKAVITDDVNAGIVVSSLGYWRQLNKGTVNSISLAEFGDMGHSASFSDNLVEVELG